MPAEWAPHDATWLSWPKNELTFPKRVISQVEDAFCRMIAVLSQGEKAKILLDDSAAEDAAWRRLAGYGCEEKNIAFYRIKSADVWIRDYGPTFLLGRAGRKAAVKWIYNAYGNKYDDLLYDNRTGGEIADATGLKTFKPGIVLEGGSIDVDGKGTLLTTEQCLLHKTRNPTLSKAQIEGFLKEYTGVSKIIWLKSGIEGDDTDGHVDNLARFAPEGKVLCAYSEGVGKDALVLQENFRILQNSTDAKGNKVEIAKLPVPRPLVDAGEKRRLPASYANFYIGNRAVLLPAFNDPNDKKAAEILQSAFPGREITPIPARELIFGYGGIHCVTQQEPAQTF